MGTNTEQAAPRRNAAVQHDCGRARPLVGAAVVGRNASIRNGKGVEPAGRYCPFISRATRFIEGGTISFSLKSQAMRLALYLESIHQTPNLSNTSYRESIGNLMRQFQELPAEQRKDGRLLGRLRIRDCGGLDAAAGCLVPVPARVLRREVKLQKHRETASQWPPETPACSHCKVK